MRPLLSAMLLALIAAAKAHSAPSYGHLFPASREPEVSGRSISIKVNKRGDIARLTPVIFLSKPGTNIPQEASKSMCGVVIDAPGHPQQGLVTIGIGASEATPSCDAVLAIGALPASRGQSTRRIGVVHAVSSRNAWDGRDAVVLTRDGTGRWSVDDAASDRIGSKLKKFTIAEMRAKLG